MSSAHRGLVLRRAGRLAAGLIAVSAVTACQHPFPAAVVTSSHASSAKPGGPGRPAVTTTPHAVTSAAPATGSTAGAAPSGRPTSSPPTTRPSPAGRPGPGTTGVVPGTALTVVQGDQVYARDGQVITGKDFHGFVTVRGKNVTFRNSIFRGGVAGGRNRALLDAENAVGTVVEDSEFVAAHPAATVDGIWTNNTQVRRANIHGGVDGVKTGVNVLVEASWIHDMNWFASDPNQGGGSTHNDGVQSLDGASGVTLRGNNIDMTTTFDANAAWQSSAKNSSADGNFFDGGGCSLNFAHGAAPSLGGISVTNNRFGSHSVYNCPILLSTRTTLSKNSGNVFDSTGRPIPPPQQHD